MLRKPWLERTYEVFCRVIKDKIPNEQISSVEVSAFSVL